MNSPNILPLLFFICSVTTAGCSEEIHSAPVPHARGRVFPLDPASPYSICNGTQGEEPGVNCEMPNENAQLAEACDEGDSTCDANQKQASLAKAATSGRSAKADKMN